MEGFGGFWGVGKRLVLKKIGKHSGFRGHEKGGKGLVEVLNVEFGCCLNENLTGWLLRVIRGRSV